MHLLATDKRLTGAFRCAGTLTVRGANAALTGILQKISGEPLLRDQLRRWTEPAVDYERAQPFRRRDETRASDNQSLLTDEEILRDEALGATGFQDGGECAQQMRT